MGEISSTVIPATEAEPEDVGALSLDGVAQLWSAGGKAIPAKLLVVDEKASQVATDTPAQHTRTRSASVILNV
ncbi:hypothetical protein ACIRD6_32035 [Streptomyces sp. NPDC102473]|uniref:hypothetical protein n=1 Tax=Streptomyces sp. NPDC102473 TaxID=3366180 RepID=UPI0037F38ECB